MATDCGTALPATMPGAPSTAAHLRVGVRHTATSLCLRIACLDPATAAPDRDRDRDRDLEHGMAQVLAAADRLLREAGSHRHRALSCELFVRDTTLAAAARRLLGGWLAGAPPRQHVAPPAMHVHSLARPPSASATPAAHAPLLEMALVVAHPVGSASA
jgi:enamine deaminase RidA (YjgF/YER057c/UK114 family)